MAKHPPYHLRTNKAVDRLLLIKQIKAVIMADVGLKNCSTYHSLGGPFMEDLHLVHGEIPSMPLVCIESHFQTHLRQKNHAFSTNLELKNSTINDFIIHSYDPLNSDIFWLDYTDFNLSRLSEIQTLLRLLLPGSLLRITVAARNPTSANDLPDGIEDLLKDKIKKSKLELFKKSFEAFLPPKFLNNKSTNSQKSFNAVVQQIIRLAISECLDKTTDREFIHIQSCYYNDGSPMLSITGLVCERSKQISTRRRLQKSGLVVDKNWTNIEEINLPFLSLQERFILNKVLPHSDNTKLAGDALHDTLKYNIEQSEANSIAALSQYAVYRHEYPTFVRFNI